MSESLLVHPEADEIGIAHSAGTRIAWRSYGNGPETILLLPTWNFVDSRLVRHQVDAFRSQYRVLTYDARGSGASDHPHTGYSFAHHVADALAVLDATKTSAASAVGASTGTHIGVLLAVSHPERVKRLVLIAPPMDMGGADSDEPLADPDGGTTDEPDWTSNYADFVPWFISQAFPEPGADTTIEEITKIGLEADHPMLLRQDEELDWDDAPRRLGDLEVPTLVVHGIADPLLGVDAVKAVAEVIPDAQLELLDELGPSS